MMVLVAVKQQMVYGPAGANGVPVFVTIATELEQLLEIERVQILLLLAAAGILSCISSSRKIPDSFHPYQDHLLRCWAISLIYSPSCIPCRGG